MLLSRLLAPTWYEWTCPRCNLTFDAHDTAVVYCPVCHELVHPIDTPCGC